MLIKLGFIFFLACVCRCDDTSLYRLDMENIIQINTYIVNLNVPENFHLPNETIQGSVTITFNTLAETKLIRIHRGPDIKLKDEDVTLVGPTSPKLKLTYDNTSAIINISFDTALTKSKTYTLQFKTFTAKLSTADMYGFYLSSYKGSDGKYKYIATTQFQPTYARRAFPCFDEPSYKAKFNISIKVPSGYTAVSNTEMLSKLEATNNLYTFAQTPVMSTYLIAFIVSEFKTVKLAETPDMAIYLPGGKESDAGYAKDESRKILGSLTKLTGTDFWNSSTLKKLDQAAIPDFSAGAMENWGLVTYRETALLYNKDFSTTKNKQRIAQIIAHEFAHMWFGNLITTSWWDTTWLNEGFARYYEYFAPAQIYKDWDLPSQFAVEQVQAIMTQDAVESARPLTSEVNTPSEVKSKFDSITYNKGASVIRMMENLVGPDKFKEGIKKYLDNPRFTTTTPKRLFDAMKLKDVDVGKIMEKWTTQPGYPVINVALTTNKTVTFQQEKFLYTGKSNATWDVPVWYDITKSNNITRRLVMITDNKPHPVIALADDEYILVNPGQYSYYRVQYEPKLLERLTKVLSDDNKRSMIPPVSRAQIVDDIMNLARSGKIKYPAAFEAIGWLAKESDYFPWFSAFNNFNFLRKRLPEGSLKTRITVHIQSLLKALYESNKKKPADSSPVETYKRILGFQWSCEFDERQCVDEAKKLMNNQMANETNVVEPDFRSIVYCSAARHDAASKTWDYLWKRFQGSNSANENVTIITALGCSKDKVKLNEYLQNSLDNNKIRRQDAYSAFTAVLTGNPGGVQIALDFLNKEFNRITASYGSLNALNDVITSISDRLTTEEQIKTLRNILKANEGNPDYPKAAADAALGVAEANLAWSKSAEKELNTFFPKTDNNSATSVSITWTMLFVLVAVFFRP